MHSKRHRDGQKTWHREAEDVRKLLPVVQSLLGSLNDATGFPQLLCPDPLCNFCTSETEKASGLLSRASLEDDDSFVSSWSCRDSVTNASLPLSGTPTANSPGHPIPAPASGISTPHPSTVSPREVVPLEDLISAPLLGDPVPLASVSLLKSKLPVGYNAPVRQPLSLPPPTQHSAVLHPQAVHSLACRQSELCTDVPATEAIDRAIRTTPESSQQATEDHNLPPLNSAQSITLEHPEMHSLESLLGCQTAASPAEPRNSSSINSDDLPPLERQDQRNECCLTSSRVTKISECFPKPPSTSRMPSESDTDPQDSAVEGKPEEMPVCQQGRDPKVSEEQRANTHMEFFGHDSLHSESPVLTASGSGGSSEKSSCCNRISEAPLLPYPIPLSSCESQPQSSPPNLSPAPSQHVPPANTEVQSQSPVLILLPSPVSQFQDCGICELHSSQDEAQPLEPSQRRQQEDNILKEDQELVWGLPSVVKNSQQQCGGPELSLGEESSRAHVPRPISPADFPLTPELRKIMEHHLLKRRIQQRWGLPKRVLESWSQMGFHVRPLVASELRSSFGESTTKSGRVLNGLSAPQDTENNCKDQLSSELNGKSEDRQHAQALGHTTKLSLSSEELGHKPPIAHDQCPTSGDSTASPLLHEFLSPGESNMEQGKKGSCASTCDLEHSVNQSLPPARKAKLPQTGKPGPLGGDLPGPGSSQPRGRRQSLPENHVSKQIKQFLSWLSLGRLCKGLQRTLEKSTLASSSLQATGHLKGPAAFPAHDLGKKAGEVLKGERGLRRAARNTTCPPSSPLPVKAQHKDEKQTQAKPVLNLHLYYQSPCLKQTSTMVYNQATAMAARKTWVGRRSR